MTAAEALAGIWYECIIDDNNPLTYKDCPTEYKKDPVKSLVAEKLRANGYENLVTE